MLFDNDYSYEPKLRELPVKLGNLARWLLLLFIRIYQKVVSPSLPINSCRYYPSCSHYGYQAIYKHGAIKGTGLTIRRVLRCNPWSEGGVDPVP